MTDGVERVGGLAVYRRPAIAPDGPWPTVVMVHGAMDRAAAFAMVSRRLPAATVVRYDRRGYGRSVGLTPMVGMAVATTDLLEVIGDDSVIVVGHSMGAVVALAAATSHPEAVVAVVALEPPMPWAAWWPASSSPGWMADDDDPGAVAEAFLRQAVGDERWSSLPARTRAARRAEGPALVADLAALGEGAPYDLHRLRGPLTVGMGTATSERHRRSCETLAAAVPGARLVAVADAGHGLHTSHPEAVAAMVRDAQAALGDPATAG